MYLHVKTRSKPPSVSVLESFAHQERCRNSTPKPPGKGYA